MTPTNVQNILSYTWPIRLEFMPGWWAALLFLGIGGLVTLMGMRSLNGLGTVRKWVAISIRLLNVLLIILLIAGLRIQRKHSRLEVMLMRDISESTSLVRDYPAKNLQTSLDEMFRGAAKDERKKPDDLIGIISFNERARVDLMPSTDLKLDTRAVPDPGNGTDVEAAINLALATMSPDAMHRLVLVWDGNATTGNVDAAVAAAAAQHVPIDVIPLHYDVQNEVMMERFIAPTWKRENEPFTIDVILRSTNPTPVTGKLSVLHRTSGGDDYLDMDLSTPQLDVARKVTLQNGLNVEHVRVPALRQANVHQFHAVFEPDQPGAGVTASVAGGRKTDTLDANNSADAFTFVSGKGEILYVDNFKDAGNNRGPGDVLAKALAEEGIALRSISPDQFPQNIVQLQSFDAVILGNVPHGEGGLSVEQDKMLAAYVHDLGGGLVMIGGDQTFGAGGWQGSEVEKVLPVDMDIPAQRQVGKGALVLIMHSCEMPDGNYWGLQCALQAIKALSDRDEIGIISYSWNGVGTGIGGASWDFQLQDKGSGSKVIAAAKAMQVGDMPSFDDSMNLALNGVNGGPGLAKSDARHKHVIIISDGDPQAPNPTLAQSYKDNKVSVSTITVYPHQLGANGLPPTMEQIAKELNGRAYGPIESKPSQLPQIFIKEATVVRRSLIHEDAKGIHVGLADASDDMARGVGDPPPALFGMVLTSKKSDPKVSMPMSAGAMNDPVLAHWQAGLGKSVVFTGDATGKWASQWIASPSFSKFWAQVVRGVSRPPMSTDFEVQTTLNGTKGKVVVEAVNKDDSFLNFLSINGNIVDPDGKRVPIRLVQTGPGTYEGEFDARTPGNYVTALDYHGAKEHGLLLGGVAMNTDPELRELHSNEAKLEEIALRTGGRVLTPWDAQNADLFSREKVIVTASPMPVWDLLIPILLATILLDVATRRIAWDWQSIRRMGLAVAGYVESFTTVRKVETRQTLDALKKVRKDVAETNFKTDTGAAAAPKPPAAGGARPDPKAKFQARGVEGDITKVVGGATDKPVPPPPKKVEPKGGAPAGPGGHTGSLLEAKRRAQQQIKKKENE
ncbi:MAG TPA: VWA domain-containing protein [Humisphaera sp.]|jgi:uncharacterized membrane protein|nr:VWA domain-containing protein [Humisphaera sp.]